MPLLLAIAAGDAWGPATARPFLLDWGVWARFVLAIAVFVLMERLDDERLKRHLDQFVDTPLLAPRARPAVAVAVTRALRRRDLPVAEVVCLALAFAITFGGTVALRAIATTGWLVEGAGATTQLISAAGWWVILVSNPLYWFLLLRWLWRHLVWGILLLDIARLELRMVVTHPDSVDGLAFIGQSPNAFTALVFAMGIVLGVAVASALQHDALELAAYDYMMAASLGVVLVLFGLPLTAFMRPLRRLEEQALLAATAAATAAATPASVPTSRG